jgi:hypothetical protein
MSTSPTGSVMVSQPDEPTNNIPTYAANIPTYAAYELDLVASLGLPLSTYRNATSGGRGPRSFKLGRRNYVLISDWVEWLDHLAETGGLTCGRR